MLTGASLWRRFALAGELRRRLYDLVFTAISPFWATKQNRNHWAQ
jgi:hypothetical protein